MAFLHQESTCFVQVIPLAAGAKLDDGLTYRVPDHLMDAMAEGCLVRIPLRNCSELGVVEKFDDAAPLDFKPKLVTEIVHPFPIITAELMKLARWIARYYACRLDQVYEMMLPAAVRRGMAPRVTVLVQPGKVKPSKEDLDTLKRRAPKQAKLLSFVRDQIQPVPKVPLLKRLKIGVSSYRSLVAKGWLEELFQTVQRDGYADALGEEAEEIQQGGFELSPDQERVVEEHRQALDSGAFSVRLLHGVTGSGKTEVYLKAAEKVLAEGGSVLFLVPEIALAPQTVARLRSRLKAQGLEAVAWHSHLADGERFDAWRAVVTGACRVVVGARSAIFAPLRDLRLIIVDEEHEPAYKQEETPRYQGRDLAVFRASLNNALCVLGSATPSMETLYNVEQGKYGVDEMKKRIIDRPLPTIHIVDMRMEVLKAKGSTGISRILADGLIDRLEKKEQSILFLNRRGFSSALQCLDCGWFAESPNSSISMTYHQADEVLRCHLSGVEQPVPQRCPQCGSTQMRKRGFGTQRIEASVKALLPRAQVVRMDADTMSKKNLYRSILNDFRRGRIDVLIGTQMIAKGLDFPNVTLVGLIDADLSMHMPDFRATERTFQLLVQVAGRAGRGDAAGEVIAQTFAPHAGPLLFARQNDFEGFYAEELEQRKEFLYPPYRHLVRHIFRGRNEDKVSFYIDKWVTFAEANMQIPVEVRGPAPAPILKIRDTYRYQVWFFAPQAMPLVRELRRLRASFPLDPEVTDVMDVDPMNLS